MSKRTSKTLAIILSLVLCFQQSGFAQIAAELNIAGHLSAFRSSIVVDKFRPVHLRYLQYLPETSSFKLFLDKGDEHQGLSPQGTVPKSVIASERKKLLQYFFIGLALPNSSFWVNLRPDAENNIIDEYLSKTDIGKIMLETDLQLKKDTASFTSPQTPEGKVYWDKLYKKAEELYGYDNVTIPTLTRPWIVPGEIIVRESQDSAYIYKATLKVMLESDYLGKKGDGSIFPGLGSRKIEPSPFFFKDERSKALNEYSSELIRELIIPKLTKEVNSSKRYAPLRQVYYSLILAQWFKTRHKQPLIDSRNLTNLISKEAWSKITYFQAYQKSFKEGEYKIQEPVYIPTGQVIRSYFSGGENFNNISSSSMVVIPSTQAVPLAARNLIEAPAVSSPLEANPADESIEKQINITFDNSYMDKADKINYRTGFLFKHYLREALKDENFVRDTIRKMDLLSQDTRIVDVEAAELNGKNKKIYLVTLKAENGLSVQFVIHYILKSFINGYKLAEDEMKKDQSLNIFPKVGEKKYADLFHSWLSVEYIKPVLAGEEKHFTPSQKSIALITSVFKMLNKRLFIKDGLFRYKQYSFTLGLGGRLEAKIHDLDFLHFIPANAVQAEIESRHEVAQAFEYVNDRMIDIEPKDRMLAVLKIGSKYIESGNLIGGYTKFIWRNPDPLLPTIDEIKEMLKQLEINPAAGSPLNSAKSRRLRIMESFKDKYGQRKGKLSFIEESYKDWLRKRLTESGLSDKEAESASNALVRSYIGTLNNLVEDGYLTIQDKGSIINLSEFDLNNFISKLLFDKQRYHNYEDREVRFSEMQIFNLLFGKLFSFNRMQALLADDLSKTDAIQIVIQHSNPKKWWQDAKVVRDELMLDGLSKYDAAKIVIQHSNPKKWWQDAKPIRDELVSDGLSKFYAPWIIIAQSNPKKWWQDTKPIRDELALDGLSKPEASQIVIEHSNPKEWWKVAKGAVKSIIALNPLITNSRVIQKFISTTPKNLSGKDFGLDDKTLRDILAPLMALKEKEGASSSPMAANPAADSPIKGVPLNNETGRILREMQRREEELRQLRQQNYGEYIDLSGKYKITDWLLRLELLNTLGILQGNVLYPSMGNDYFPSYFSDKTFGINAPGATGLGVSGRDVSSLEKMAIRAGLSESFKEKAKPLKIIPTNNFKPETYFPRVLSEGKIDVLLIKGLTQWGSYYDRLVPGGGNVLHDEIAGLVKKMDKEILNEGAYIIIASKYDLWLADFVSRELGYEDIFMKPGYGEIREALSGDGEDAGDYSTYFGGVDSVMGAVPIRVFQKPKIIQSGNKRNVSIKISSPLGADPAAGRQAELILNSKGQTFDEVWEDLKKKGEIRSEYFTDPREWPIDVQEEQFAKDYAQMSIKELEGVFINLISGDRATIESSGWMLKFESPLRVFIDSLSDPIEMAHHFRAPLSTISFALTKVFRENGTLSKEREERNQSMIINGYRYKAFIRELMKRWNNGDGSIKNVSPKEASSPLAANPAASSPMVQQSLVSRSSGEPWESLIVGGFWKGLRTYFPDQFDHTNFSEFVIGWFTNNYIESKAINLLDLTKDRDIVLLGGTLEEAKDVESKCPLANKLHIVNIDRDRIKEMAKNVYSSLGLKLASERYAFYNKDICYLKGIIPDGSVALAVNSGTLAFLTDREAINSIREMERILAPGGIGIVEDLGPLYSAEENRDLRKYLSENVTLIAGDPNARKCFIFQKKKLVSSALAPNPAASSLVEKAVGGIDFRALPIVTQAMSNLKASLRVGDTFRQSYNEAVKRKVSPDLDGEWQEIERMASSGITPSSDRIKEYLQASCVKGNIISDKDKIILLLADILRSEEEDCCATDPVLRDILVVLETSGSSAELSRIFLG